MKIGLVSDHRGYLTKQYIKKMLKEENYEYIDYGSNSEDAVDYPDYAFKLCNEINNQHVDLGIAICGTGIGMSIACNKIKGIRCAKVSNEEEAILSRKHNDANVLALRADTDTEELKKMILYFLTIPFSGDERHLKRIGKISEIENK